MLYFFGGVKIMGARHRADNYVANHSFTEQRFSFCGAGSVICDSQER